MYNSIKFFCHLSLQGSQQEEFLTPGVILYFDNILVTGPSDHEHLESLNEVFTLLEKAGLIHNKRNVNF